MKEKQLVARAVPEEYHRRFKTILCREGMTISGILLAFCEKVVDSNGDFLYQVVERNDLK